MQRLNLEEARKSLNKEEVIIIPTDTIPGLAVDATNPKAIEKIYKIKKREAKKRIPLLFSSLEQVEKYLELNEKESILVKKFWPGALTLILKSKGELPQILENDAGKIGARIPANEDVKKLIEILEKPIAATSINISGESSITQFEEIPAEIAEKVAGILAGNYESIGKASTVMELNGNEIIVHREGALSAKSLKAELST